MAESNLVDEHNRLQKSLRWHHGFMLALPVASGLFISVGNVIGAVGTVPAVLICATLAAVALLQNKLFAEMAAMFPEKPGGVAMYASEAWKRYFAPIGPLAAFGYWCGWALVLALVGLTIGSLIQAQWFTEATWTLFTVGDVSFGLPHTIAVAAVIACIVLNVSGIRVAVRFNQVIGAAFIVVLAALAIGPFVTGGWNSAELTSHIDGGWKTIVVWLYVSAWAIYGTELCAAFAPEYRDTTHDTSRALTSIALFMVAAYTIVPLAATGKLGEATITNNPTSYGILAVQELLPGLSGVVTAVLCGALFLSMISSSADAGRALYGIAQQDMTIKQFDQLNRNGVPSRSLWVTMVVNILIVAFVGDPVAILIASNLGYILAITLAVIGFLLLRKDRPHWPRDIKLGRSWIPIATGVALFNTMLLAVGISNPGLSHHGGPKEVAIGIALLSLGIALFGYRRVVQDRGSLRLREHTPAMPEASPTEKAHEAS